MKFKVGQKIKYTGKSTWEPHGALGYTPLEKGEKTIVAKVLENNIRLSRNIGKPMERWWYYPDAFTLIKLKLHKNIKIL